MRFFRPIWAIAICGAVAACSTGTPQFESLSEQDLPDDSGTVGAAAAPVPEDVGLFDMLLGNAEAPAPAQRSLAATAPVANPASAEANPAKAPAKQGGLLAFLTGGAATASSPDPVQVALTTPEDTSAREPAELPEIPSAGVPTKHKSIFGINSAATSNVTSEVTPGTLLPYGKVARVCGLSKREMGKKTAQYPERRPKHVIYDSAPDSTTPRSFYITGFGDGCARQFTASLAVFGSVAMHEQLRYGLPAEVQPYSDTDKAYEKLKGQVCGVPRKKPCGAKVSRLDGNTVFVSIYERFGSNASWANLLLHSGNLLAQDLKGG